MSKKRKMKQTVILILFSLFVLIPTKSFGNSKSVDHYNQGMKLIKEQKWLEAEKELSQAIELNQRFKHAYNLRGTIRNYLNNLEGALEDLNRAIDLDPHYEEALIHRGSIWIKKRNYEKALADLEAALRLNPNSTNALYNRGNAYLKLGQGQEEYELALEDYERVLELNPSHRGARNKRILTKQILRQLEARKLSQVEEATEVFTPSEPPKRSVLDCLNPFKWWMRRNQ